MIVGELHGSEMEQVKEVMVGTSSLKPGKAIISENCYNFAKDCFFQKQHDLRTGIYIIWYI